MYFFGHCISCKEGEMMLQRLYTVADHLHIILSQCHAVWRNHLKMKVQRKVN